MEEGELVYTEQRVGVLSDLKIVFHSVAGQPGGLELDLSSHPIVGVSKGLRSLTRAW